MNKAQKKIKVENLIECLSRSQVLILTDFTGLKVDQMTELRQQLKEKDFGYIVVKNTLLSRASKGQFASILIDKLAGPNGLGFSYDDPVGLAKILVEFAKANPKLILKVGVLSGKLISADQVVDLAKLPGRKQLLSIFLGTLHGVPRNLVNILAAIPCSLLNILKAIGEKKTEQTV